MTTDARPEGTDTASTAVAPRARLQLSPELQQKIEQRRLHSAMVAQIKGATWGKDFDENTIRAVATWARENDVDPVTEVHVLGGQIYIGARYYERKLSELIGQGAIERCHGEWVQKDARLDALAKGGDPRAEAEINRRTWERIQHGLSDEADFACVYHIKHRLMSAEVVGAKEHVPGKKKTIKRKDGGSFTVDADPVGDQAPMETVETRALRRAMLKLKDALPGMRLASSRDDETVELAEIVESAHAKLKADQARPAIGSVPLKALPEGNPYDIPAERAAPVAVAVPPAEESDEELLRADQELVAREESGEFPLGDRRPANRSAQSQGH